MARAIVGANWGDEGKGKITDMLAQESDIVIRFQGGSNAGHTIINNYGRFAMHLLPSGVFSQHTVNIIGNGVALNIPYFIKELNSLTEQGVPKPNIMVSDRAQILMPSCSTGYLRGRASGRKVLWFHTFRYRSVLL